MKKVIERQSEGVIYLDQITDKHIVGISFPDGEKVMVIQNEIGFIGISTKDKNLIDCVKRNSKIEYINRYNEEKEVFVFDSMKEIYKWLSE